LYATFLCQFNKKASFLKNIVYKEINDQTFFDYSHKFLLQIPIYLTAKLSISNLVVLCNQDNLTLQQYEKLLGFIIPNDVIIKSAPETNQQQIIECFVLTAKKWDDYIFFKELQTLYNCFYDFEFIDFDQYLYILLDINPGLVYDFKNISNRINQFQYCNIKLGKYSSTNFYKYIFKCNCEGTEVEYRNSIHSMLKTGSNPLLVPIENAVYNSWTYVTYDIECGRIKLCTTESEEAGSLTNPLDSYVQTICCVVPKEHIIQQNFQFNMLENRLFHHYVFVYIPDKSFTKQFLEYKKNKKNAQIFIFYDEYDMLCASLLFLLLFNQINDMNGLNFDLPFIVHRLNILKGNLSNINYVAIGWPFSIQSSIQKQLKKNCPNCKLLFNFSQDECKKCKHRMNNNDTTLKTIKYRRGYSNFPLSVHIDLQYLDWEPNKALKKNTNSQSLESLSTFWFKQPISFYNYLPKENLFVFFSNIQNLKYYYELAVGFGQSEHEIIWFNYLQSNVLIKNYSSRLIKTEFFFFTDQHSSTLYPKDQNRHDVKNLLPLSNFLNDEFSFETTGLIAFYVIQDINRVQPTNPICFDKLTLPTIIGDKVIDGNVPPKSYISFTKLDINSFKQRNPSCCQDYIDLVEYCMIDTLLTSHLSIVSRNHIYCLGARTYRLPIYMSYIAKSGNIANYIDCLSKFNYSIQTRNMNKYNQYLLYETCNLLAQKRDSDVSDDNIVHMRYGKAFKIPIANTIPDLFSGELNISECNLKLIGEKPINETINLESVLKNLIKN
jgi:hypothetical protein